MTTQAFFIGDTWSMNVPVTNPDGSVVNLTTQGLTPGATYWPNISGSSTSLTVGNGITMTNPTGGIFSITIPSVLSNAAQPETQPRLQIFLTDGSGNRTTIGASPTTGAGSILYILPLDPHTA